MDKLSPKILLVCFLIGALGIIVLKQLHVNQFFVTAYPIAIMLVYATHYRKSQHLLGRVGDNLYYLGFLYTLVSLGASLFEFSLSDESMEKITQIITNFGIAIASTIFGIIFRVLFNQSEEHEAPEEEVSKFGNAVSGLSERVSELNVQLGEFTNFRIGLEQILRESSDQQKKAISQSKASVTRFTKTVEENSEQFQVFVSGINEQVSHLNSAIKANSEAVFASVDAIKASAESVAASASDLVEKINRLQVPENLLEQLLRPPIQQIETGEAKKTLTNETDKVWVLTTELEHHLQRTTAAVAASISDLVKKTKNIQLPENFLEQLLRPSIQQIETGAKQIGKAGEEIANKINNLQANNTDQGRLGKLVGKKLANKINIMQLPENFLEQLLRPSIQQIETGAKQIGKAGEEIANKINNVWVPNDGLEHHLQQTAAEISASMNDLVEKINSMQVVEAPPK